MPLQVGGHDVLWTRKVSDKRFQNMVVYPHNSNPRPANAAALLKQEDAATSAAGACDFDSSGSDATAE